MEKVLTSHFAHATVRANSYQYYVLIIYYNLYIIILSLLTRRFEFIFSACHY